MNPMDTRPDSALSQPRPSELPPQEVTHTPEQPSQTVAKPSESQTAQVPATPEPTDEGRSLTELRSQLSQGVKDPEVAQAVPNTSVTDTYEERLTQHQELIAQASEGDKYAVVEELMVRNPEDHSK